MYKIGISSFTLSQLDDEIKALGVPSYRAKQIFKWLHSKLVNNFTEMTDLPKTLISMLDEKYYIETAEIERKQQSADGTIKYLFKLHDENCIETVLMRYSYGNTVCVSSQVGCRMGCRFCASTKAGLVRSLSAGEIAAQIYSVTKDVEERVSHIVLMGIGEPLDNFDNVMSFLNIISSDDGINIGMRNISLSTCGIVPQIQKLKEKKLGLTLSISLHAPNNTLRSSMMPINDAYSVEQLIAACREYQSYTKRRISFEYSLVKNVNDTYECAQQLAKLIDKMGAHVNLIPINPVDGSPYTASDSQNVNRFKTQLENLGVNATVRRRLGTDISAACGQLRLEAKGANR